MTEGASITQGHDSRMSTAIQWALGVISAIAIAALIGNFAVLWEINTRLAVLSTQAATQATASAQVNAKQDVMQTQLNSLQIKVGVIEARQAEARSVRP